MAEKIGTQTGIVAAKLAEEAVDPAHKQAYEKLAATEQQLVDNQNELIDRVSAVEGRLSQLPFGAGSS